MSLWGMNVAFFRAIRLYYTNYLFGVIIFG